MTRGQAITLGALAGALAALLILVGLFSLRGDDDAAAAAQAPAAAPSSPANEREGAAPPSAAERPSLVETRAVTVYRRALDERLSLVGTEGQVVWFGSPVDRARQVVRLVLDEPARARGAVGVGQGVRYRDVHLDATGTAWVDLVGESLDEIHGSDAEMALVAALSRSLVESLDEVQRVGLLVDGEPRRSLAGHVDLDRTYTGREWPLAGE